MNKRLMRATIAHPSARYWTEVRTKHVNALLHFPSETHRACLRSVPMQVIPYDDTREIADVIVFSHHVVLEGTRQACAHVEATPASHADTTTYVSFGVISANGSACTQRSQWRSDAAVATAKGPTHRRGGHAVAAASDIRRATLRGH